MTNRICVLCGGPSQESAVSMRSADRVYKSLKRSSQNVEIVEFDENIEKKLYGNFDTVFNIMHGRPGEDGRIQAMLEKLRIPYTGSGVIASALTMNKYLTQKALYAMGVPVLNSVYINKKNKESALRETEEVFKGAVIIKPNTGGSSVGAIISPFDEIKLNIEKSLENYSEMIIEDYIENGQEITVGVIEDEGKARVLTPLELRPKNKFYDYEAKYTSGKTDFIIPADVDPVLLKEMIKITEKIFLQFNMRTFARVDFIVKNGKVYELEVNSIPGMTDLSDLPQEAEYDGVSYDELVLKLLKTAGVDKDA